MSKIRNLAEKLHNRLGGLLEGEKDPVDVIEGYMRLAQIMVLEDEMYPDEKERPGGQEGTRNP